jgi:Arc/MetJ family transcription regulator
LSEGLGVGVMRLRAKMCTAANRGTQMRTNIEIDDRLMKDALKATGAKTKREAVEMGLRTLVQLRAQEKARELKGKITWEGDLNAMRTDR